MKTFVIIAAVLLSAAPIEAQVLTVHQTAEHPVFGHLQNDGRTHYDSPADWPKVTGQGHWCAPDAGTMTDTTCSMPAHTHVELQFPMYAELSDTITVPLSLKLFDTKGHFGGIYPGVWHGAAVHDVHLTFDTISPVSSLFPMMGEFKTWNAHFTIEPDPGTHGWFTVTVAAETYFDNGDFTSTELQVPAFSMADPTAPENQATFGPMFAIQFTPFPNPSSPGAAFWGPQIVQCEDFLPTVPLSTQWRPALCDTNGYGSPNFAAGATFEQRIDPDLHNLVQGTTLLSLNGNPKDTGKTFLFPVLDPHQLVTSPPPAGFAANEHLLFLARRQPSSDTQQLSMSILTLRVKTATVLDPAPPMVTVPDLVNWSNTGSALAVLDALGLVGVPSFQVVDVLAGTVLGEFPAAGTTVQLGSTVVLNVSIGPADGSLGEPPSGPAPPPPALPPPPPPPPVTTPPPVTQPPVTQPPPSPPSPEPWPAVSVPVTTTTLDTQTGSKF